LSVRTEIGTVQFLRYVPNTSLTPVESIGVFEFPLIAVIRYLEEIVREYRWSPYAEVLRDVLRLARHSHDVIALNEHPEFNFGDFDAANLIDRGRFSVYCCACQTHFYPSQISRENWSYHHGMEYAGGGRCYTCSEGHVLLNTQDWLT
jgi:hypothetical protein